MTRSEQKKVGRLQYLFGHALAIYENDRAPERAGPLRAALSEGFELCVGLLGRYPPEADATPPGDTKSEEKK
jgi:hypothetical protein